jgi:hypothetical protein
MESAAANDQAVAADLLDAPGDAVAMSGPIVWRVLTTMRASVPRQTSVLGLIASPA